MSRDPVPELDELLAQRRWARNLARSLLGDETRADDVAQDALVLALRQPRGRVRDWRAWLAVTLRRLAYHERRGDARRHDRERAAARDERDTSHEHAVRRAELQQELARAVLALDEPFRTTILLRYLEELDVDDVARRMDVPAATVRTRTARGLEALRARFRGSEHGRTSLGALALLAAPLDSPHALALPLTTLTMKLSVTLAGLLVAVLLASLAWNARGADPTTVRTPAELAAATPHDGAASGVDTGLAAQRVALTAPPLAADASQLTPSPSAAARLATARLSGRLVTPEGAAIPDASVFLFDEPLLRGFDELPNELRPARESTTDATGSFTFEDLAPSRIYGLVARGAGHAPALRDSAPADLGAWKLARTARWHGRVLDEATRAPQEGVELAVASARVEGGVLVRTRSARTDAAGRFALDELEAPQELRVEVAPPGALGFAATIALGAPGDVEQDVLVRASMEHAGTVVDRDTGTPVADATIQSSRRAAPLATTDERGRFTLRVARGASAAEPTAPVARSGVQLTGGRAPAGAAQLAIRAPGWCASHVQLAAAERDAAGELVLPLVRAGRIEGLVLGAGDQPVADANVTWGARPPMEWFGSVTARPGLSSRGARTDAAGRFVLAEVPSRVEAQLVVSAKDRAPLTVDDVLPRAPGETRTLVVRLDDTAALRGSVRLNGAPHSAYVYLVRPDGALGQSCRADEAGRFAFDALAAGEHVVKACTSDGTAAWSEPQHIALVAGVDGVVALDITAEKVWIRGRVVQVDGPPLAGLTVTAYEESPGAGAPGAMRRVAALTRTSGRGVFEIGLPAEKSKLRYEIATFHGGTSFSVHDVATGREDIEIALPELARVRLRVVARSTGAAVERVAVDWVDTVARVERRYHSGQELSAAGGRFELQLPKGALELVVSAPSLGFVPARVHAVVGSADAGEITVELDR